MSDVGLMFVGAVLFLSFYLGSRAKSAKGYYAAHGQVGWFVNGIAFAGDYLSAASFLGICGLIAFYGYDGFLYSIGYLAGWIVALFVIAETIKRLGKFTFADALDNSFPSFDANSSKVSAAQNEKLSLTYWPAFRSSFGVASHTSCPLGGDTRLNSNKATPAFLREVR